MAACAGVYVWGKDWIQAKTQAECYDYLFEAAVKMAQLGINAAQPPAPLIANGAAAEGKRHAENGVSTGGRPWRGGSCRAGSCQAVRVFLSGIVISGTESSLIKL
jgi:hypothetical protein